MRWSTVLLATVGIAGSVLANKEWFDDNYYSEVCSGMYSKLDWGGSYRPHIGMKLTRFDNYKVDTKKKTQDEHDDISLSYVIFEYKDINSLGVVLNEDTQQKKYICDDLAVKLGYCDSNDKGLFIVKKEGTNSSTIHTGIVTQLGQLPYQYNISRTGYYCVATYSLLDKKYRGIINFQNAFGHLSASEIPKLPAYGILTICYAIALSLFGFQFYKKRKQHQILPLQRYLLAMFGILTFETFVIWSYYDLVNRSSNPLNGFIVFYMVFLSLLNATKLTFSFFLLLCISLGYGVVVLKLKKSVMFKCKILAGVQFAASVFYFISSYRSASSNATITASSPDDAYASPTFTDLLPMIPITITCTVYYACILNAIRTVSTTLHQQRQVIKLKLYNNLFYIIFMSVFITMAGLVTSSFLYLSMGTTEMIENHWKGSFFFYNFWPSIVFFISFLSIAWLWRPTETSYMLALSQQVSTTADDEEEGEEQGNGYHQAGTEFELDDLSLMSNDDERGPRRLSHDSFELSREGSPIPPEAPPKYDEEDSLKKKNIVDSPENSNTLFELGEEEDDHQVQKSDSHTKSDK
ncbi:uncharacterized protein KQ657_004471 [Scheffersomyces spartinae]|uniref:Membrane protein PTM1 n=1 Tax=Scheffersomyces spartinae TaxID=45513 RepID=A0A9P8AJH4_9ASCO|nr:uncharacterized protein KQ657_004471 [Scheffersomyces spartinae]KAG7194790.1 hypothetical protein KQ657_004471 [Scheffersomyces spartinae]